MEIRLTRMVFHLSGHHLTVLPHFSVSSRVPYPGPNIGDEFDLSTSNGLFLYSLYK